MARINSNESYRDFDPDYNRKVNKERKGTGAFAGMDIRSKHASLWSKSTLMAAIAGIGFIAWIAMAIFKLAIPAKWTVITWLFGFIGGVGKFAFFAGVICLVVLFAAGYFFKFTDWIKEKEW